MWKYKLEVVHVPGGLGLTWPNFACQFEIQVVPLRFVINTSSVYK